MTPIDEDAIDEIDRLHRRYATYSARPGRPLRFLRNLLEDRPARKTLHRDDVVSVFSRETGLPRFMLDDSVPFELARTKGWFGSRVIGQPTAVDVACDVLAMAKARLSRPQKPLGSLLFIGPTGVGKTEMAKSLAEFLFGDRARMIRFDMSEFADPLAVERLVGDRSGSEALTARVRETSFAVLLLDEFEKADPAFFDLLLQVLGEGRLTDAAGRVADFSACLVVMTSNLGAASFQRGPFGFASQSGIDRVEHEHFLEAVRSFVRPELFNRIDRIVPFTPLTREVVERIARRELDLVRRRDGIALRDVELNVEPSAVDHLVERGYDPAYGARPLKRTLERELVAPLAEAVNLYSGDQPLVANVAVDEGRLDVRVRARPPRSDGQVRSITARPVATAYVELRREVGRLERSPVARQTRNEQYRLERAATGWRACHGKERADPRAFPEYARLRRLATILDDLETLARRVNDAEEQALLAVYEAGDGADGAGSGIAALRKERSRVLLSVYALRFEHPDQVTVAVYGDDPDWLFELAGLYYRVARGLDAKTRVARHAVTKQDTAHWAVVSRPEAFFRAPEPGVIGIAVEIAAPFSAPRFEPESGIHELKLKGKGKRRKCLVRAEPLRLGEWTIPSELKRRGSVSSIRSGDVRRLFNGEPRFVQDLVLKKRLDWSAAGLAEAIDALLTRAAQELIEE